jgi:hypothetical protein
VRGGDAKREERNKPCLMAEKTKEEGMKKVVAEVGKNSIESVSIKPANMKIAEFKIVGNAPLVIHRFSKKTKDEMLAKQIAGKTASSKKVREPKVIEDEYNAARYISKEGWDGFNASSIRLACIDVCRLVGFKMTLAKMSVFVLADGVDKLEPQIPLIRIYGDPILQEDMARVETGQPYICIRPAYHEWYSKINIRWDADQFTIGDITNLLSRAGLQCGIGEGRPFSKNSGGMGWGTFDVVSHDLKK